LRKDIPYGIVAGIILTLLMWLVVMEVITPESVPLYAIPMCVFIIILWLNAWRIAKKTASAGSA
jgi:hypothetical protein